MSITPEMIDAMLAAGLDREQMAALMKAGLADAEREKAERKAKAAAKKRRQRAQTALQPFDVPGTLGDSEGQSGTEGDIEGQSGTSRDISEAEQKKAPHTPKENTPSEITPSDPKGSSVPKGPTDVGAFGSRTDSRQPTRPRQIAEDFGFQGRSADDALAEFADYWRALPGVKGTKLDWPATLRNRLREVIRRQERQQPRAGPRKNGSGNGFYDLLRDELGNHDGRSSDPQSDRPRLIAGARH